MSRDTKEPIENKANIFIAAEFGTLEEFLIRFKVQNINIQENKNGQSLLHRAISGRNYRVANFLIRQGINLLTVDYNGNTVLHYLCDDGNPDDEIVVALTKKILDKSLPINAKDSHGNNALWSAIHRSGGNITIIKLLLNSGADAYSMNNYQLTPLDLAKRMGWENIVDLLISYNK